MTIENAQRTPLQRRRSRCVLTALLACVTTSAFADTRSNPYVTSANTNASQKTGPAANSEAPKTQSAAPTPAATPKPTAPLRPTRLGVPAENSENENSEKQSASHATLSLPNHEGWMKEPGQKAPSATSPPSHTAGNLNRHSGLQNRVLATPASQPTPGPSRDQFDPVPPMNGPRRPQRLPAFPLADASPMQATQDALPRQTLPQATLPQQTLPQQTLPQHRLSANDIPQLPVPSSIQPNDRPSVAHREYQMAAYPESQRVPSHLSHQGRDQRTPAMTVGHGNLTQSPTSDRESRWLQSITPTSCMRTALDHLDDAKREYAVRAFVSAEDSAWKALASLSQAIDVTKRNAISRSSANDPGSTASQALMKARTAIREARDFQLLSNPLDTEGIQRMVQSHQTTVLKQELPGQPETQTRISATEAADRYLDHARTLLGQLAVAQPTVAQTLDLLAAIQLGRGETRRLPEATSLCFRRAAFQGQPGNGSLASRLGMQLAEAGLDDEATSALEQAYSLTRDQETGQVLAAVMQRRGDRQAALGMIARLNAKMPTARPQPRLPEVIQLSPAQFASVSPSVNSNTRGSQATGIAAPPSSATSHAASPNASPSVSPTGALAPRAISASVVGFRSLPGQQSEPTRPPSASETMDRRPNRTGMVPHVVVPNRSNGSPKPISKFQEMLGRVTDYW